MLSAEAALRRQQQDWNDLAAVDPLWAIFTAPGRQHGGWNTEEFFLTGEREIAEVMSTAAEVGLPESFDRALDFGCGVGRTTRALSFRFAETVGVDISERMIERARELNADRPNCTFLTSVAPDLGKFEANSFDLVYSNVVLQHLQSSDSVCAYVAEFIRVIRTTGLVVFQMPFRLAWRHRLQPRRRLYRTLRGLGMGPDQLYRLRLNPMRTIAVAEDILVAELMRSGGEVLLTKTPNQPNPSRLYFVRRTAALRNHDARAWG
jgi:SAM-dependent methyltransferase